MAATSASLGRPGRNLIVLADGTGNSAAKASKTNVWRLYQALDLTDGSQVAAFGDGVGTSSITLFRVLGLALGIGVKRNVLNLYKFLSRNYNENDKIWVFGFSRGAFTIRVLAGLIWREGLIAYQTEDELNRNALAAYRAYRKKSFPTLLPWVWGLKFVRDRLAAAWAGRPYSRVAKRDHIPIHFIGVWDTVAAYGLPIDELTRAVDRWVWPMSFASKSLLDNVRHARHAFSLDDERRTFFPIPWDEKAEPPGSQRLRQVWFPGAHADVGGGYPDDGLSYVALCWMIDEAAQKGLRFEPNIVAAYRAVATPTGRIYDSRSGFGAFWRYQPRNVEALMGAGNTPLVHGSVITRMAYGNDGYAPISLPRKIDVLPPSGGPVELDQEAAAAALEETDRDILLPHSDQEKLALHRRREFLADMRRLAAAANGNGRDDRFALVLDTVWWRRVVYFISLFWVGIAASYPLTTQWLGEIEGWLGVEGAAGRANAMAGGTTGWSLGGIGGFLPGAAQPWIAAVARRPAEALLIVVMLLTSLRMSGFLQRRIYDRARAAWGQKGQVAGIDVNRLKLTGQRDALMRGALAFGALAAGTLIFGGAAHLRLFAFFALLGIACAAFRLYRAKVPPGDIDPANPGLLLRFARKLRRSPPALRCYRFVAQTAAPALFLGLCAIAFSALAHRTAFDLLAAAGVDCHKTLTATGGEKLDAEADIDLKSLCQTTGLWLLEGRKYRISLTIGEDWFDKRERTDVVGFPTAGLRHFLASPLKRWWWENWFQPIARIGDVGNYEHPLAPSAPLPTFNFVACPAAAEDGASLGAALVRTVRGVLDIPAAIADIPRPAPEAYRREQVACRANDRVQPTRELISDITADASGELFIYVNDAVLAWPGSRDFFYRSNSGAAKVHVTRIVATPVIGFEAGAGDQARRDRSGP